LSRAAQSGAGALVPRSALPLGAGPFTSALAIERRAELTRAKAEEQEKAQAHGVPNGAPSKQAERRAGKKPGPDAASTRDLAKKTGMGRINRARKLVKELGTDVLEKAQGNLAKPAELDALVPLGK
jgi:hypothetical protein